MKKLSILIALCVIIISCGENQESSEETVNLQDAFFENLSTLCGETFTGGSIFPDDPDNPLVDTELRTHISECDNNKIRIELYRDGDYWHGAWVVEKREDGLHLYHDHLGEVRMEDELGENDYTGYGGYADNGGSAMTQFFAADDATAEMIPAAATNVWMMDIDLENETFVYYLERNNEPRFRAELFKN